MSKIIGFESYDLRTWLSGALSRHLPGQKKGSPVKKRQGPSIVTKLLVPAVAVGSLVLMSNSVTISGALPTSPLIETVAEPHTALAQVSDIYWIGAANALLAPESTAEGFVSFAHSVATQIGAGTLEQLPGATLRLAQLVSERRVATDHGAAKGWIAAGAH